MKPIVRKTCCNI